MTHVFTENIWLCDIPHSIVCNVGGGSSDTNSNQQQAFANTSTGNQAGQYANGPINSAQLQGALDSGQNIYNGLAPNAYAQASTGLNSIGNAANQATGLQGTGNNTLNNTLNGSYLSAANPYFGGMVSQLGDAIKPQVDGQFAAAGRYGSGANANTFADSLSRQAGQLAYQNYGAERGNQMSALNNLPSYTSGLFQPGQAQMTAGYAPLNQFTQQLSQLKPGTAGSYGQSSGTNTAGNGSGIATGDQSNFGVNTQAKKSGGSS